MFLPLQAILGHEGVWYPLSCGKARNLKTPEMKNMFNEPENTFVKVKSTKINGIQTDLSLQCISDVKLCIYFESNSSFEKIIIALGPHACKKI